jgi:hypothetical protein
LATAAETRRAWITRIAKSVLLFIFSTSTLLLPTLLSLEW